MLIDRWVRFRKNFLGADRVSLPTPRPSAIGTGRDEYHPLLRPVRYPAVDILTTEVRFNDFLAARLFADQPLSRCAVYNERFVEAGQNTASWGHAGIILEGKSGVPDLVHQRGDLGRLQEPAVARQIHARDREGRRSDLLR